MSRICKNNSQIYLYQLLSHHRVFQKKPKTNHCPNPAEKPMSEMFCSPSKLIRLSVEHESSANTHPAVISTLSHFAFVKFRIPGMSQGLYCGREMMFRTQIYFCVCVCVCVGGGVCGGRDGVDLHWSRTVWKWRTGVMNYVGVKEILLTTKKKENRLFKHNAAAGVLHSLCKLPRSRRSKSQNLGTDVGSKTVTTGHVPITPNQVYLEPKITQLWCGTRPKSGSGKKTFHRAKEERWRRATEGIFSLETCSRCQIYRECQHQELVYNLSVEGEKTSMGPGASRTLGVMWSMWHECIDMF